MESSTITSAVAAKFLGCSPQQLRLMARERPEQLGFNVSCPTRTRVKISRESFIQFLCGQ
uniref:Excisionase n=1 Tax=Siphoviridae sp. ctSMg55 TaxID=2825509 RepID=A0A8S5V544_9CAUD|nr:MAG TPA: excisionase [Siphoviridae sp. ctSMg55]